MPDWTKEQLDAINKSGKNIIVSAGAGSGKTAVLSERVFRILKEGTHINEVLVLTFTNAAAAEMKERIRKRIKSDSTLLGELDLIDSSYITTFDSFALSILKKYHYLLNISNDIKIVDSALINVEKNQVLDSIFERYYEEKNSKFINLITTFCVKDDKEIKKDIIYILNKLDLKIDKKEYLENYISNYFNEEKIDNDIQKYETFVKSKIDEIKQLLEDLESVCDNKYYESLEDSLKGLINTTSYDEYRTIQIKLPTLPKDSTDDVKEIKEKIGSLIKEIKDLVICSKEEIKTNILSTKSYVEIIIEIIKELDQKLNDFKFQNNVYEFNDIAKLSIQIIKENESIKEELKNSFKEILIDEYQDTSDIQEAFISLIENNNVYMVGDIKQSIYRFRNANPYIFKTKYDNYSKEESGIKIDLNKNFRSREEVLNNINDIFNEIMTDLEGGANYRLSHNMIFGNISYKEEGKTEQNNDIQILEYEETKDYKKEEIEAFIIANDIENKIKNNYKIFDKDSKKIRDITYNDIVILIDRVTDFDKYKEIFTYKNIPLVQIKDYKMNDEIDLHIIKNILKLIIKQKEKVIDTEYKYLFTSIARSFLINMNDNEIYKTVTNEEFSNTEIINKIDRLVIDFDNITISKLIDKILKEFDYYNKLLTLNNIEESLIRIERLKEYAKELESLGYTINDYVIYLEELLKSDFELKYSKTESAEGVRIMTIHKSKGLEYHICYYPGLYKAFNISDIKEKFTYDSNYGIITPYFKEGIGTTIYKTLMKDNYIKEEKSEKIRLFYVALTRAKEQIILVRPHSTKIPNSCKSFNDLLSRVQSKIEPYIKNISLEDVNITKNYKVSKNKDILKTIPTNNSIIQEKNIKNDKKLLTENKFSKDTTKIIDKEIKKNIEYGLKVHEEFELDDFTNPTSELVKRFLKHFDIENSNIVKEYEFIYEDQGTEYHGIIDLLIEHNDYIDIVDYKLKNTTDPAYIKQLTGYQQYIEKLTNKKTNLYLYSIINDELNAVKQLENV